MNDNNNDNKPYDSRPTWYLNKIKRNLEYSKKNTKRVFIALNVNTDNAIIEFLDSKKNKQGYIKDLIIKDMEQEKRNH